MATEHLSCKHSPTTEQQVTRVVTSVTAATSQFSTIIAIDPGVTGGIACWKRGQPITAAAMPPTEGDLVEVLQTLISSGETIAYVELVGGYIGKAQPGSAMFAFGRNF